MLRDIFNSVRGIESFGMISMIIFILFFVLLVLYAISLKEKDVKYFSRMPLDDLPQEPDENQDI
jgi:hypothetical protein